MATMHATTGADPADPRPVEQARSPEPPSLWQVPIFVIGVAALVFVGFTRPFWHDNPLRRLDRDLANAKALLARPDSDTEQILRLATRILEIAEPFPDRLAEASFVAGSAEVRLAEKADPTGDGPVPAGMPNLGASAIAREHWLKARRYLQQAEQGPLSAEAKADLPYRSAKVAYFTGGDLHAVINRLEESVPTSSRRAEGYQLLTRAYLRMNPPDLTRALEANRKLRDLAELSDEDAAPAKLIGGDLLLRMGKPDEARKTLERIGDQAPPAIVSRARLLRARTHQIEKRWSEAARVYQDALADARAPLGEPAEVWFHLGVCLREQEQPREAIRAWQECLRLARGPEGPAAALVLAEQRLLEPAFEPALEVLNLAVTKITNATEWKNPLIDLNRAREVFERAAAAFRQASRHDLAMKLLEPYARLAVPDRLVQMRAEIAADAARVVRAEAAPGAITPEQEQKAADFARLAGDSYAKLSEQADLKPATKGEYLWNAAQQYLAAKDLNRASTTLKAYVTLALEPERLGEAWYRLAETYAAANKQQAAIESYRKCMDYNTKFQYRARYQLAMASLLAGDPDQAESDLVVNLKWLRWDSDPEALSQSLFALGNLLYKRHDYRRVVRYLEDALSKEKDGSAKIKEGPELTRPRYQLADSYRQIAAQENQSSLVNENMTPETRQHYQNEYRRWLRKSAEEFTKLEAYLELPEGKDQLDKELRDKVPFIAAKCWFDLGESEKALAIYDKLIDRYPGKVERLNALGGAVSCHALKGEVDKVKQRLLQIQSMLRDMPEEIRTAWDNWVKLAVKQLETLDQSAGGEGR